MVPPLACFFLYFLQKSTSHMLELCSSYKNVIETTRKLFDVIFNITLSVHIKTRKIYLKLVALNAIALASRRP